MEENVLVNEFNFSIREINRLKENLFVKDLWPVVYILSDKKRAYIGETTNTYARMIQHLANPKKQELEKIHLITSNKFNKSATLDIESSLISYMSGDNKYEMLNGNAGIANHNYYQKYDLYKGIFNEIWDILRNLNLADKEKHKIENDDMFKYSPYKALNEDQKYSLVEILESILKGNIKTTMINGGAGTGKSILAIFLFKLLNSDLDDFNNRSLDKFDKKFVKLAKKIKSENPNFKMGLVIPMSSFRETIKKVFKNIDGLSKDMVIGPSQVKKENYDLLIVDESHRLRKRKNLGTYYSIFDKTCEELGFDKNSASELDWVIKKSKNLVLFYDENQSIKPSDANREDFKKLKTNNLTKNLELKSQLRVKGGEDYISYVFDLLNGNLTSQYNFVSDNYEFSLVEDFNKLVEIIKKKDDEVGLSRLIAGYSWPWVSRKEEGTYDIEIEGIKLKWNSTTNDWINKENSVNEVGCIHTTQGYDLNYAGIIFGKEIGYDKEKGKIIIKKENYYDRNGKNSIKSEEELKQYILNIYSTIMLRGIKGTFVYVCDPDLREYFKQFIPVFDAQNQVREYQAEYVKSNDLVVADSKKKK